MRILTYMTTEKDAGRRVGALLQKEMRLSRSLISRLKFHHGLFLDGQLVRTDVRVLPAQRLEARLLDDQENWQGLVPGRSMPTVVYEDEDLMILEKPAPLPSISSARQTGETLENQVYAYLGCPAHFVYRPVNRLDKGTSGLMVVAKNAFAQEKLQKDLHTDAFVRRYQAVCEGKCPAQQGVIDLPIAREREDRVRRVVRADGKPCVTHYRVMAEGNKRSLVELQLETGRTHQIRVHLAALGCPIAGDYLYGQECDYLPGRFALHACYVKLRHPVTGAWIEKEAALPEEIKTLLNG